MGNINILELTSSIRKEGYKGEYVDAKRYVKILFCY